jgi:hypothetical protein
MSTMAGMSAAEPPVAGMPARSEPATTFTELYDMLFPMTTNARCVACHSMPANDIANGNLQMGSDKAAAYAALVGRMSTSTRCMNRPLVMPSQPDMSLLLQKLTAAPPCGSRMPLGGNALTEAQLAKVRSWIAAGAKDD